MPRCQMLPMIKINWIKRSYIKIKRNKYFEQIKRCIASMKLDHSSSFWFQLWQDNQRSKLTGWWKYSISWFVCIFCLLVFISSSLAFSFFLFCKIILANSQLSHTYKNHARSSGVLSVISNTHLMCCRATKKEMRRALYYASSTIRRRNLKTPR